MVLVKAQRQEKAIVFIDGSNTYFAQKKMGKWLDWVKVIRHLKKDFDILSVCYYAGMRKGDEKTYKFLRKLRKIGFTVITKPVKIIYDESGRMIEKANFDVEIAGDVLECTSDVKLIILFSGDSDFDYLAKLLHKRGKKIYAYASRRTLSWELKLSVDRYIFFEDLPKLTKKRVFVRI